MDYILIRCLCALLSGVLLSQSGSLIQLASRNLLASPSTLGFDGLSILFVLLFHSFSLILFPESGVVLSFLFGLPFFILSGFIYLRVLGGKKKLERLILMGLTFNLLVGAIFSLWQFLFVAFNLPFPVELWFGHFRYSDISSLAILVFVEIALLVGFILLRKEFLLFSLGHTLVGNLKLKQKSFYLFIFSAVSVATFAVISLFGAFSFLGLVFPLVARRVWFKRFDLSGELLVGAVGNGCFLMLIDSICYYFPFQGAEIPVGLIATGVGALSLIFLLWKSDRQLEILAKTQK